MLLAHKILLIAEYSANVGRLLAKQCSPCCLIKARHAWIQLQVTVDQTVLVKHIRGFFHFKKKLLFPKDEEI